MSVPRRTLQRGAGASRLRHVLDGSRPAFWLLVSLSACGGGGTPPASGEHDTPTPRATSTSDHEAAGDPPPRADRKRPRGSDVPVVIGETGGLDPDAVTRALARAEGAIDACWNGALDRNAALAGRAVFVIKVGSDGRAARVSARESDLGDREMESCIARAFGAVLYPRPVGGASGRVERVLEFPVSDGQRRPLGLAEGSVDGAIGRVAPALRDCKAGAGATIRATLLLRPASEDEIAALMGDAGADAARPEAGVLVSAGFAAAEEISDAALDCAARVLKGAEWPPPGAPLGRATVTF